MQMLIMNNDENDLAFQTLSGIVSLTSILNDLPIPTPCQHSLSSQSLLYEPRLSEEAHSWLSSEDATLVHSLTIAIASTNTDNIEFKDSSAIDEVDHNAVPPLFKAIITHNEMAFRNKRGFSGIFKQPNYLNWDNNYDQQINFNSIAYQLTDIMTPSPEDSKSYTNKECTDNALQELHDTFPEFKFSSDAMNITNKVPSNMADITYSPSDNKLDNDEVLSDKTDKKKSKKKKHKDGKHSKDENGQYSILKSNPDSQKLVLSLIKSPENHKKSKKKKKKRERDDDGDRELEDDEGRRDRSHKKHKSHRRDRVVGDNDDREGKEANIVISQSHQEPIKKIKLNIKLSNNGDNAQIISSTVPLSTPHHNLIIVEPSLSTPAVLHHESSPLSSKQCFTSTFDTPSTILDRISQCSTSSLLVPSSQEPDHHMWNYPIYSNKADDQFDLSIPIDISGNNFSDFMSGDDILSPLNLNMANNSMLNSVLRESVDQPFLIEDFDTSMMDTRPGAMAPGGLASYLSSGAKDNDLFISDQHITKSNHYNNDMKTKLKNKKNKRRKNEVEGLKTWSASDIIKEPVIELTDLALDSTWDRKLDICNQKYKDKAVKRKRNLRNITQNSEFVFEHDADYPEGNNGGDSDSGGDPLKRPARKSALTYAGMDEGDDGDGDSQRPKKRKKEEDEPYEAKIKEPSDMKYLPLKKCQENVRKRRERVLGLTKISNTSAKLHVPSDMLDPSLITESTTYQHFISLIDSCLEDVEHVDLIRTMRDRSESDVPIPPEVLMSRENLQEMCKEIAKLKATSSTKDVPIDKLTKINTLLMLNICSGSKICLNMPENDNDEAQNRNFRHYAIEKIGKSLDACFVAMNIMTSSDMHKEVFIEDVIESAVSCVKYQLNNLIFPEYDPAYRVLNVAKENQMSIKRKRAHEKESTKSKSIINFYNRMVDIISNLSELVAIQTLTDNVILQLSSLGISVYFVENINDIQLASLRLVTTIFSKYEKHRNLIIDDILASLARLPSSKKNLRNYRLNSEDSIQMLTALSLLLVQSVVNTNDLDKCDESNDSENVSPDKQSGNESMKMDREQAIEASYSKAMEISFKILRIFLMKSTAKGEDDYKAIFENFVTDLLLTVNKPEWPAAELMLNVLGSILTKQLVSKQSDQNTRVTCIDYLGTVAATLRRDAVTSPTTEADIDSVIKNLLTGSRSSDDEEEEEEDDEEENGEGDKSNKSKNNPNKNKSLTNIDKLQILRDAILDYLAADKFDPSAKYARQFYFGQWFTDSLKEIKSSQELQTNKDNKKKTTSEGQKYSTNVVADMSVFQLAEDRRNHLLYKMFGTIVIDNVKKSKNNRLQKLRAVSDPDQSNKFAIQFKGSLDYEDACLVCRYIASLKPFSQSFDVYLTMICRLLNENSVAVRTKAMRCLSAVVEADPSILSRQDIERSVHLRFHDPSTLVREAAIDLVGKYLLTQPQLIPQYYPMIADRILDKGTSVRKRVIRIFRDICVSHTEFPKIPEICVKMIRRINDEDAIKKLVNEVFQNMWFSPVREKETVKLLQKVMNITDVVSACTDIGYEWFDQLLEILLKKDDSDKVKMVEKACKQIVDCLVQNIMRLEEISSQSTQRLVSCLSTLNLFTKIRPELMVHHAMTLQPYLNIRRVNHNDDYILHYVARILEVTVPLIEHPSDNYINQIEEDMVKLILNSSRMVLESCVACLASTVNKISHNYSLVKDCFQRLFNCLLKFRADKDPNKTLNAQKRPMISRSLFTVGLLCKYFDFNNLQMATDIMDKVFETLIYFAEDDSQACDIRMKAISGIGFLCIRYRQLLLSPSLSVFYEDILLNRMKTVNNDDYPHLVCCVLDNLSLFFNEEEEQMLRMNSSWKSNEKSESLKEMGDMSSGMSSQVAQNYLNSVHENVLQPWTSVRAKAVGLIVIIVRQGLVNPIQSVPYLISAQTDPNPANRSKGDIELTEINKRIGGYVNMKASHGVRLSGRMQEILAMYEVPEYRNNWCRIKTKSPPVVVRGVLDQNADVPVALNNNLYTMLRSNKSFRRSFLYSLLTIFGEMNSRLSVLIYISDNLAHFSYQSQEEPLYLVHNMDIMVSSLGTTIIQQIQEQLFPELIKTNDEQLDPNNVNKRADMIQIEDEEDPVVLVARMHDNPGSLRVIRDCVRGSRGCVLLVALKQFLRELYSLTDAKINKYSPTDTGKAWERQLTRRSGVKFDPIASLDMTEDTIDQESIYQKFVCETDQQHKTSDINLDAELYPGESLVLIHKFLSLRRLVISLDCLDIIGDSDDELDTQTGPTKSSKKGQTSTATVDGPPINGLVSSLSSSHHSAVIQGQSLRVEVDKLDMASIPHLTATSHQHNNSHHSQHHHRRPTHKKTLVHTVIDISSNEDSDDHQREKRSRLTIQPNPKKLLSKAVLGSRHRKKSVSKHHQSRHKSPTESISDEDSSQDDNADSDPDFVG